MVYKDPKTGDGTKKSQKGMVCVYRDTNENIKFIDGIYMGMATLPENNMLETIFKDGVLVKEETLHDIRTRLHGGKF